MKNVLFAALIGAVATTTTWAQTPEARPATPVEPFHLAQAAPTQPAAPAAQPRTPAPATPAAPATAAAQAAPPTPAPPATPPRPPAAIAARIENVRFDVTITDSGGPKPVSKTVSLTVSPGNSGSVRSSARTPGDPSTVVVPAQANPGSWLNVDVRIPGVVENGVRAQVNVEYQPYVPDAKIQPGAITAGSTSVFYSGRKTQILVTSDPISDRKTTIEVTATILN